MSSTRIPAPAEGQLATEIHIDTAAIPSYMRDRLAMATMDMIRNILKQPGGREALAAKTAARNAQKAQEAGSA